MSTMIPENVIETNKETFCTLLRQIRRDGAKIDDLIKKLESSDFFYAPASTKYHNSVKGGLCDHSLNVYYNLRSLVKNKHLESFISEETILICGLLHDISKINVYEESIRNKKVYHELGKKYDNLGNFDWVSEKTYQMKDIKDRFIYGNHEETSEYMIRKYIPLKLMSFRISDESTTKSSMENDLRVKEANIMFNKFWPKWITKLIMKYYVKAYTVYDESSSKKKKK